MGTISKRSWSIPTRGAVGWGLALLAAGLPCLGAEAQAPPPDGLGFEVAAPAFVAVRVRDDVATSAWYQRVLGLAEIRHLAPDDRRFSIRLLTGGGLTVELIRDASAVPADSPHLGLFKAGIYVADIDATFVRPRDLGVDVDQRIFVDESLRVRSFVFRDIEGNRLQVFERCAASCDR